MITSVSITGADVSQFGQTNDCTTVTPGGFCTANVTFAPNSPGIKTATLRIASNDPDTSTYSVTLQGFGLAPKIEVSRVLLEEDFSAGIPGTWLVAGSWIKGPTGGPCGNEVIDFPFTDPWAIIDSLDPSCPETPDEKLFTPVFDASFCSKVTLFMSNRFDYVAGAGAKVAVTADSGATWSEVLVLSTSEGPIWNEIDLGVLAEKSEAQIVFDYSGSGGFWAIDNLFVLCQPAQSGLRSPLLLSFKPQTIMIRNTGTQVLDIGTLTVVGADASSFNLPNPNNHCSGETLSPSEMCTAEVIFSPASPGDKSASLSIPSNDSGSPALVALTGEVVDFLINPLEGTIGTEITLTGTAFGPKGKVLVDGMALKVTGWTNEEIRGTLGKSPGLGVHGITVQRKGAPVLTDGDAFTMKKPEIYWVNPSHGPSGTAVTIRGKFFGSKGKITIGGKTCKTLNWTMDAATGMSEVQCTAPKGLDQGAYPLIVSNKGGSGTGAFTID